MCVRVCVCVRACVAKSYRLHLDACTLDSILPVLSLHPRGGQGGKGGGAGPGTQTRRGLLGERRFTLLGFSLPTGDS